jgi:uncharacterized protein
MPNRLAGETSPYLLQHAHNPVDWYPWGPEALERAKREDKPIFLSIGYAACHWCHVMERESFEDVATAADLNRDFVAVKVDREERPDLDQVYMGAVQALTGQGGWPMSVFLTPEGKPFYGGTYFPPRPAHGMPAFRDVLAGVARAWREERLEVVAAGQRLVDALARHQGVDAGGEKPTPVLLDAATAAIEAQFDARNGGWGSAPKFPQPMTIEYLLRRAVATGDPRPLAVARRSLDAMADGGIRDQLGGGFHRYATDAIWLVPHFEQMLYDNAQLARVYVHAWQLSGDPRYREVAEGTLDYLARELRRDDGVFAASQDADTEGVEGKTFTWSAAEIREVLGDEAAAFLEAYGVTDAGNWEGTNVLSRVVPPTGDPEAEARLAAGRSALLARRAERAQPARDDKALAAWNGLAIAAFAEASGAFADSIYSMRALTAADRILAGLRRPDGRLGRSWKDGRSTGEGVLEDYANLADGLLAVYEDTWDERWFVAARELADAILDHFSDPAGGFFDTADDHEALVTRPKDVQDNAVPSGGSMAASVLLRLAALTGDDRYQTAAEAAIATVTPYLARYPTGFANWLSAAHLLVEGIDELAIVGFREDDATGELAAVRHKAFRPNLVVAGTGRDPASSVVPLLEGRVRIDGKPTAYLCLNFACRLPVTEPAALREQLAAGRASANA